MAVTPTYPGVYVQEVPSGVRTIVGAQTSIGMFIGAANGGPVNEAVQCLNYSDFLRAFGSTSGPTNLGRYVRLFFMNGGTNCYVMRIAANALQAAVNLHTEAAVNPPVALTLTAKQHGKLGEMIRAEVSYSGARPESTFNIDIFRWEVTPTGARLKVETESFKNLTMDPTSPNYAVDFITQTSKLVEATVPAAPVAGTGYSQAGRSVLHTANDAATFRAALALLVGSTAAGGQTFELTLGANRPVAIDLATWVVPASAGSLADTRTLIAANLALFINGTLLGQGVTDVVGVAFVDGLAGNASSLLRITGAASEVVVRAAAAANDLAVPMLLGVDQGGLEVGPYAGARPAPTGLVFRSTDVDALMAFAGARQDSILEIDVTAAAVTSQIDLIGPYSLVTTANADPMATDSFAGSPNGHNDGVREKLAIVVQAINDFAEANPDTFTWRAEMWGNYRLALLPTAGDDNLVGALVTSDGAGGGTDIGSDFIGNVRAYSLGATGAGPFQSGGVSGFDGTTPTDAEYTAAYDIVDTDVDLFNLMVLPPDATVPMETLYPEASVFCKKRRAFLVMDPPGTWRGVQQKAAISPLRIGLEKDHSAIYYPRLVTTEGGREIVVGPSGAIAGLMGRVDGTRGVWKAPAGTEATLKGVSGLEQRFTDEQNGVMNPRAVNHIRVFPNGIVSWGARTMDGDDDFGSEYKYIPVRRLALFIEETLYRNLKWVVFEPNDDPLYAQIRLNVGAFMQDLFRKGAFEGRTPKEAYSVRCDRETTTDTDRNLGIVNIWVAFAPLKPAEFVVVYIQQKAAQAEV